MLTGVKLPNILGRKIIHPTTTAAKTIRSTAPAATSLAVAIRGSFSRVTRSASFSTAVLNASAIKTPPMQSATKHHSRELMFTKNPTITTHTAANK